MAGRQSVLGVLEEAVGWMGDLVCGLDRGSSLNIQRDAETGWDADKPAANG